jgi:hypothetical protein
MTAANDFTIRFYFQTLTRLLGEPRRFFGSGLPQSGWRQSLGFLILSGLFFTGASIIADPRPKSALMAAIFFVNAVGMPFVAAGLGYMVMMLIMGRRVGFAQFFSIYALSSGATLLVSWVPFFLIFSEPWKWWLIATGMVKGIGFRWVQALLIIGLSIGIWLLFFWTALPLIVTEGG